MGGDVARTGVVPKAGTALRLAVIALVGAGFLAAGCAPRPLPVTAAKPSAEKGTDWPAAARPAPPAADRRHESVGDPPGMGSPPSPSLEWPPPDASAIAEIEPSYFLDDRTLLDAATRLRQMLVRHGYEDLGWYVTQTGFAVVTRCERIDGRGAPLHDPRFSVDIPSFHDFSFSGIARAMFSAPEGRFRVIMIAVTSDPASIRRRAHGGDASPVEALGLDGDAVVPQELQTLRFQGYTALILFYEISKVGDKPPRIVADGLTVDTHIRGSGLETR
jgi:hypothetical protein